MKEYCIKRQAEPLINWIEENKNYTIYIGKAKSNLENTVYWLGSCLGQDKEDIYFKSFNEAISYAKNNIKEGFTLLKVEGF